MAKIEISLQERRLIQLKMLDEFHAFCESNNLRYSLAFGTLIGAIRHKGFIPWDDDVDIMMPLPDMIKLKESLVSKTIKYCDVDTEKHFEYAFSRLAYNETYSKRGITFKSYGVNIDLYPVFNVPDSNQESYTYFERGRKLLKKRLLYIGVRNRIISKLPVSTIPGFDHVVRRYRDYMLFNNCPYGTTNHYFVFGGSLDKKEREACIFDFDPFKEIIKIDFEGHQYNATSRYHNFLTQCYGDYMQLPPEEKRKTHHKFKVYWK